VQSSSVHTETERLGAVRALHILDTGEERLFDDITSLASLVCETPFALLTFVDQDRVWFKSKVGLQLSVVPRKGWFCDQAILQKDIFIVTDTARDVRFQSNLLVASTPNVRFYAGVPLILDGNKPVGTLCILDAKPRELDQRQQDVLRILGGHLAALLASRRDLFALLDELNVNKELAASATKVKSSFLANMSHEIRTPMTAILGMTDLLLSGELQKDQREYIETIRSSGESLLNIINDILDFSKIESGKMELDLEPLDLRACIEETLDVVSQKARERGNELLYVIDANVPHRIVGDIARLRQILVNLINNANKFTKDGEVFLSVLAQEHTETDFELMFSVKDTGIGIPKDKLESIFEAFTQADSSVTRKYGGAGLGLVICSRLVGLMGGRIGVESAERQGSKFFFTVRTVALPDEPTPRKQTAPAELEGKRILLVDDSATNLQILSAECKQWGMIPTCLGTPKEALELLKRGDPFDVAIYDMQMPEKDGVQLAMETRELCKSTPLAVILLSSWDLSDPRIRDHHDLFAATVMKPLKISQFQSLLKDVIGKQRVVKPVRQTAGKDAQNLSSEIPVSIVVAEDNLINQKLIQRMLRSMGYEPTIVSTGIDVLKVIDQAPCDLLFMDVQMPEMDGLEATQRIREKYGKDGRPRIIAMTAFALAGDKEKCLQAGMDDYLSKPFVSDQVASVIRKWGGLLLSSDKNVRAQQGAIPAADSSMKARLTQLEEETEYSFVKELVGIFLDEAPTRIQELKDALQSGDSKSAEQIAHKLKGGSINLGIQKLHGLFENIERLARENTSPISQSLIAEVDNEFARSVRFLRDYMAAP